MSDDGKLMIEMGRVLWPFALLVLVTGMLYLGMWAKHRTTRKEGRQT
jgi:hypothetical protein